jgi:tRNA 2-thiocytidine biosynthesis protein TtcA
MGVAHRIEYRDTYSIVTDKLPQSSTYCSLCSRLRRGHLYRIAREEGCSARGARGITARIFLRPSS